MAGDALIKKFETHLDDVLPNGQEVDVVVSRDCTGLNTGRLLLRVCDSLRKSMVAFMSIMIRPITFGGSKKVLWICIECLKEYAVKP